MGNQHEIRQVTTRSGLGVVIPVQPGHTAEVVQLLGEIDEQRHFYTYYCPAGERITCPNLDGPDISLDMMPSHYVVIQSGGKMWCGYEAFVGRVRMLAPHLGDAHFFVGDEEDFIDEFRLAGGRLRYHRAHEGGWLPLEEFIQTRVSGAEDIAGV